ncbi:MAG: hypothetical protein NTY95_15605 [Bacteroidia bacterium]|nr:hypothetical protein [Bacteroidia bacterium]
MKPRLILVFIFLIFLLDCSKKDQVIDQDRLLVISRSFSSQGGRMALCNSNGDSAILEIPADALSGEVTITMKILDIPPQCLISDIIFPGLILEPENLVFNKAIQLKIKFSESIDQADRVRIFNISPDNEINFIETQNISNSQLVGKILHFSSYLAAKPSYDEICTLMDQIVVYGGDADALGILEILQDAYDYFSMAKLLDVLGQSEKADEAREAAMGYLEEKTYEILDYIPTKSCGLYQISLDYLLQVLEVYIGTSDITKSLKVKITELENKCESDDLTCDNAKVKVSPGNILIEEGNQYPIDLEYEAAANGETYIPVIKFFSLNRDIATVNNKGIIQGIKEGQTTIFVRWCDKSFDINVVVESNSGTFIDGRDGQEYKWIKIGQQIWMAENLNYSGTGSRCYDDNPAYCNIYGRLYTYEGALNACPSGWHLPRDGEWSLLNTYLGGGYVSGYKLKEAGTIHWHSPNPANNESGFTALPGGRFGLQDHWAVSPDYLHIGLYGYWWTSTMYTIEIDSYDRAIWWILNWGYTTIERGYPRLNFDFGSVRCIKDN